LRDPTGRPSIGLSISLAVGVLLSALVSVSAGPAEAREARTKTLKLHFGHTGERGEFTFKRNGRYDKKELARINKFLRDWRQNEPAKMDPQLLDLVWAIYQEAGGRDYIHVVSAYRSLKTNNMLRSRSQGVAKKSQHTAGRAMDFYIPGVPLAKLRAAAMRFQSGGVGYYPASGSPFVHVDTGSVRYWPRMPRKELLALFPNGETVYLPADGKPLPGYQKALARNKGGGTAMLAYLETGSDEGKERLGGGSAGGSGNWLKRVFSGGADEAQDNETAGATKAPAPAPAAPAAAPAPVAPEAPVGEPPIGEPQILVAEADSALETRLPQPRPSTPSELVLAALPPEAAPARIAAEDAEALGSLGDAPLPRSRPDASLLADSLSGGEALGTLAVAEEDAIAALAARADAALPVAPAAPAPLEVALLPAQSVAQPEAPGKPDALRAIEVATGPAGPVAETEGTAGVPLPRPRPVELAFAGSGLPAAEPLAPKAPPRQAAAPAAAPRVEPAVAAVAAATPPAADDLGDRVDPVVMQRLTAAAVRRARGSAGSGMVMPDPAGAQGFFAAPANADAVGMPDPMLPAARFKPARADAAAPPEASQPGTQAEESFFSRLFASLAE